MAEAHRTARRGTRIRSTILAVSFAVAFVVVYVTAILTPEGQQWDAASLGSFPWLRDDGWLLLYRTRDWLPFVLLGLGAVAGVEATIRRRWVAVVAAGALVALTALASHTFKAGLLPRPDLGEYAYSYQTFPSGHTAMSLAAVVAIVWFGPRWLHPVLVVVLGAVVGFVAVASLLSYAHRASDIVGGVLLVGALACAISAVVGGPRLGRGGRRVAWTVVGLAGIAAGSVLYVIALTALAADAAVAALIDPIGMSAIVAVGGVVSVVLANQHPIRTPSVP